MAYDIYDGARKYDPRAEWLDSLYSGNPIGNTFGMYLPVNGDSSSDSGRPGGGGGGLPGFGGGSSSPAPATTSTVVGPGTSAPGGVIPGAGGGAGAGPAGAVPGWMTKIYPYIQAGKSIADIWSSAAGSRAAAQQFGESAQLSRDRLNLDRALYEDRSKIDRADLDLKRRQFGVDAPAKRLSTGTRAAMISNAGPVRAGEGKPMTLSSGRSITPVHYSGLDANQLIGDKGRQLAGVTLDRMLQDQLTGDKFDPIPDVEYPDPQGPPEAGWLDRLLEIGGLTGGTLDALGPLIDAYIKSRGANGGGAGASDPTSTLPADWETGY